MAAGKEGNGIASMKGEMLAISGNIAGELMITHMV